MVFLIWVTLGLHNLSFIVFFLCTVVLVNIGWRFGNSALIYKDLQVKRDKVVYTHHFISIYYIYEPKMRQYYDCKKNYSSGDLIAPVATSNFIISWINLVHIRLFGVAKKQEKFYNCRFDREQLKLHVFHCFLLLYFIGLTNRS